MSLSFRSPYGDPNAGSLTLYTGPMCAGKSGALIAALHAYEGAGRFVEAFQPAQNTRDHGHVIRSRNGSSFPATRVRSAEDIVRRVRGEHDVVALDEPHMLEGDVVQAVMDLKMRGLTVVVAGLSLDYRGMPLAPIPSLLCYADRIVPLTASNCAWCKKPASFTRRRSPERAVLVPGGDGMYEPLCASCWVQHHADEVSTCSELS